MSAPPLLAVDGISKRFRGLQAVDGVSFEVPEGAIVALIGPNGAGKTTIFNLVAGVFRPETGRIRFHGRDITGFRPHEVCDAGIARTFQLVKPFGALTVAENVMVGALKRAALMFLESIDTPLISMLPNPPRSFSSSFFSESIMVLFWISDRGFWIDTAEHFHSMRLDATLRSALRIPHCVSVFLPARPRGRRN